MAQQGFFPTVIALSFSFRFSLVILQLSSFTSSFGKRILPGWFNGDALHGAEFNTAWNLLFSMYGYH